MFDAGLAEAEEAYVTAVDAVVRRNNGVIPDARNTERRAILLEWMMGPFAEALVTRPLVVVREAAETTREDVAERACIGFGRKH
ncbi:hypothetical protein N9F40_00535 [bacterium]|nr:hypothetical protein [bacterium]